MICKNWQITYWILTQEIRISETEIQGDAGVSLEIGVVLDKTTMTKTPNETMLY